MGKELVETDIEKGAKYFWEYLADFSQKEVVNFIHDLSEISHVFIFSGIIRNFFLNIEENARDIDIVYQGDDLDLIRFLKNYDYEINSFSGFKITIGEYQIDLWKIDSTWAIENSKLESELFNQYVLPDSAFFNFSAIVYDFFNEKFIFSHKFLDFLNTKTLDLVLEDNPLPQLCIINTIYYREKFGLKISSPLKNYCVKYFHHFKESEYESIQIKHFQEVKYSFNYLKNIINVFSDKLKSLLFDLELLGKEELYYINDLREDENIVDLSSRSKEILSNVLKPDAFFTVKGEPLILFYKNSEDGKDQDRDLKIWNYNQSAIVFVYEDSQWKIKNGFKILSGSFNLEIINTNISEFEYLKILSGQLWEKLQINFRQENRVDYYLLDNISTFRTILIEKYDLESKIANSLIGRGIFVRYLIDRGIDVDRYGIRDKEDFDVVLHDKVKTYKLFRKVLDDFKGNLFPLSYIVNNRIINEEDEISNSHLEQLSFLLRGMKFEKDNSIQTSFINLYDFSIIPIEFISNIYERFIGVESQADNGAYYTPLFLVDYIQNETIKKFFENNPSQYECKVLDPACGSGVFLVETYRKIIAQYKLLNPDYNESLEKYDVYRDKLKQLLVENIFGIDQDENAINIAIFSLYVTLLDNLEPKSIKGYEFPTMLDKNFYNSDFFNTKAKFNLGLKHFYFQFILGNPPWKTKHPKEKQLFENYVEQRRENESSILEIENREIAEAFLIRVSDFQFHEVGFIVVSKILYKLSRKKERGSFRKYFLTNFLVRKVVELSSVRHQIFNNSSDAAVAPATILFYRKVDDQSILNDNIVTHVSLKPNIFFEVFKLIVIEKYDIKHVYQKLFIQDDYLWKVLVYGNILDYNFISRFKAEKTVYDYINDEENFLFGKGISVGGGDRNNISEHINIKNSINSKQKGLQNFDITYSDNFLKNHEFVHRPRNIELFKAKVLLVGKGITKDFKAKAAISYEDVIYTDAITGIKPLNDFGDNVIYTLETLFNSKLFSYFLVQTNSSIGIEREQSHDKEDKFSVPLIIDHAEVLKGYSREINQINNNIKQIEFETSELLTLKFGLQNYINKIDNYISNLYHLSAEEKSLLDYTTDITIPMLKGSTSQKKKIVRRIRYLEPVLEQYAGVFYDHFKERFKTPGNIFKVEILWSEYVILMKFNIGVANEKAPISWMKIQNNRIIEFLVTLGFENLSENLFLQKDIKGFENDFFYIAKPNQFKSWHSALAQLDLAEFIEEFFKLENEFSNED